MKPEPIRRISALETGWRLEKRVPLALLVALASQFVALVAWATWQEARIDALERRAPMIETMPERFARLEERLDAVRAELVQLRRGLERR